MKTFADYGIVIAGGATGEIKTICPQCSHKRSEKNRNYPCLNVNTETGVWHCWHCEWAGGLQQGTFTPANVKIVYSKPIAKEKTSVISQDWRKWLNGRGISDKTIEENRLFSGNVYMPQIGKESDAIIWPYYRNDEMVNCKYRDKAKNFRMYAGAERILYGYDHISEDCLVWVEGEMDKLSVYESGFKSCVSVPDGAPAPTTKNYSSKFAYLESCQETISKVKKHIIAVDSDEPGQCLKKELIRRLGVEKCFVVNWPSGIKDANDMLLKEGVNAVYNAIVNAKAAPVEGVFSINDIFDEVINLYVNGTVGGLKSGWENLDPLYSVRDGDFTVVTGIPSHGKSEWLDALLVLMAKKHGQRYAICSPENQPLQLHIKKLSEKWIGRPFFECYGDRMSLEELIGGCGQLEDHFCFILPEEPTIDCILNRARIEVYRKGINGLVIDPWNELEHSRPAGQSETEYISDSLRKMRKFARDNNIHLWIVAHPTKLRKKRDEKGNELDEYVVPTPYDVAGAAHWRNKGDNCITVYRNADSVDVHIQKVRVKEIGKIGTATFTYKVSTGEYFPVKI
jgi:twinkle protein